MMDSAPNSAPACSGHLRQMSNDRLELHLDPRTGRIVYLSTPGGANALWTDPLASDHPMGGWLNHGGEKIWLWPQNSWKLLFGADWPPPCESAASVRSQGPSHLEWEHTVHLADGTSVRLTRRLELLENASAVRLCTQLECATPERLGGLMPWSVLQIPRPQEVRVTRAGPGRCHKAWFRPELVADPEGWSVPTAKQPSSVKCFFDATALSAHTPAGRLTVELANAEAYAWDGPEADKAQIFVQGDTAAQPSGLSPYIELEFVAARSDVPLDLILRLDPLSSI